MVQFGDLKMMDGMKKLNEYLASRSYIEGYAYSDADKNTFDQLANQPPSELYHAARWYRHISAKLGKPIKIAPPTAAAAASAGGEEDFELFGADEVEDAEAERVKAERVADYEARKSTKKVIIAKSSVVLDVKPWDDETDMAALEAAVRGITMEGLLWGASKLVPVAFGVRKLQIGCVVEDDKVSIDDLSEKICEFEDYAQSVDIAAFNKI